VAWPAGLAAVAKDGTHLLVVPVVQDLAEHIEVTGRYLTQEVAGDEFGPAGEPGVGEKMLARSPSAPWPSISACSVIRGSLTGQAPSVDAIPTS
jgi:hypothetical protein